MEKFLNKLKTNLDNIKTKLSLWGQKRSFWVLLFLTLVLTGYLVYPWLKEYQIQLMIKKQKDIPQLENPLEKSLLAPFSAETFVYKLNRVKLPQKMHLYQQQDPTGMERLIFPELKQLAERLKMALYSQTTSVNNIIAIFDEQNYLTYNQETREISFTKNQPSDSTSGSFEETAKLTKKALDFWQENNLPPSDLASYKTQESPVKQNERGELLLIKFIPQIEKYLVETDRDRTYVIFDKKGEIVGFSARPFATTPHTTAEFYLKSWAQVQTELAEGKGFWDLSSCPFSPQKAEVSGVETVYFSTDNSLDILPCYKIKAKLTQEEKNCETEIFLNALREEYMQKQTQ